MATESGMILYDNSEHDEDILEYQYQTVHWKPITHKSCPISFPPPQDININMMPFRVEQDYSTIPSEYRQYIPFIQQCVDSLGYRTRDQIYYLTIHESWVPAGSSQRRPGLHTDAHSTEFNPSTTLKGRGYWHRWGGGENGAAHVPCKGGIFMASNVADSTAVWDCNVKLPGLLGDCEALRGRLSKYGPTLLEANRIYWMTDRTPHEAMPLPQDQYRQYFRLVTEAVDIWYDQHSTPNPLGVMPPDTVKVVSENKFGEYLLK